MKRIMAVVVAALLLTGCGIGESELDRAMQLRQQLQKSDGCSFDAEITADYGEELYTFQMWCEAENTGEMNFTVVKPDTIAGISGIISSDEGELTFDDKVLGFPLLADGQITPVSAPWLFIKALRGGYLKACAQTDDGVQLIVDDSYEESSLQVDIWLDENNLPCAAEMLWDGRRVVSLKVTNFIYR